MAVQRPRLWLALRLSHWPLQALDRATPSPHPSDMPRVVVEKQRVICTNETAAQAGITPGMALAQAQLLSECQVLQRNAASEREQLQALCEQLYDFTPYIQPQWPPDTYRGADGNCQGYTGVLLELSRCLSLFGGLRPLTQRVCERLGELHYCGALAHTALGAWLLSHGPHYPQSVPPWPITEEATREQFQQRLCSLPTGVLYAYPQALAVLAKSGFRTLGDIQRQLQTQQSFAALHKRLGGDCVEALRAIFDMEHHPQQARLFSSPAPMFHPQQSFVEHCPLEYPVEQTALLLPAMGAMLLSLQHYLRERQLGCQGVIWHLVAQQGEYLTLTVEGDNRHPIQPLLQQLTAIQLEVLKLPWPVDSLRLLCPHTTPLQGSHQPLDFQRARPQGAQQQDFALTLARLQARLGREAIRQLHYRDQHRPEASNRTEPFVLRVHSKVRETAPQLPAHQQHLPRPQWLFDPAVAIQTRSQGLFWRGYLQLLSGPERIVGDWWDKPFARDYFVAERQDHLRLWVYRDLQQSGWYVQGVFA